MRQIPPVRTWIIRVVNTGERYEIPTVSKKFARMIFRQDYVKHWQSEIKVSLKRSA